jgi:mRNA interferase RelE/StbE
MGTVVYKLRVPEEVAESIREMHPHLKRKIRASLKILLADPAEGKPLKEEPKGLMSFRVSRFRIIYRVKRSTIEIVAVGPRSRIYEETLRLVINGSDRTR